MSDPATTLRWFGHRYDAPAWDDMPQASEPVVGQTCVACPHPILEIDDGVTMPDAVTGERHPVHLDCFLSNLGIRSRPRRIE